MKKIIIIFASILLTLPLQSQTTVLVNFGSEPAENYFGLAGWNTLLLSADIAYTASGVNGVFLADNLTEYADFMGVSGPVRNFQRGERIAVTWYNNSAEPIRFISRISFTDNNNPDEFGTDGAWFTMRNFDDYRQGVVEIQPYSISKTVFNIESSGVHQSNGSHSLVNINIHIEYEQQNFKPYLICDKIELMNDADITAPQAPTGLTATVLSDSKIRLNWNIPSDNVGVADYLLYMNGEVEGYSRTNAYTVVLLEHSTPYTFTVTALDNCMNESNRSLPAIAATNTFSGASNLINPTGFEYLGAFALPDRVSYGSDGITYNQDGDGGQSGTGSADGFAGSLFVSDINQPEFAFVGEVGIPAPFISATKDLSELNTTPILQDFVNIRPANINSWSYIDVWRTGLEYIPPATPQENSVLYSSWAYHYQVSGEKSVSISSCIASNLAGSAKNGAWYIGTATEPPIDVMLNDYLFSVPQTWATSNLNGRNMLTGRFRDGGLSGLGPTLYAFERQSISAPPPPNTQLPFSTLLIYGTVENTDNYNYPNSLDGYKHGDSWKGVDWLSTENQAAIVMFGNKALGDNWYGYQGEHMPNDLVYADLPYPDFYETDPNGKGWKSHNYCPIAIFYNPADLASVAQGLSNTWSPQPYSALRLDKSIFWGSMQEIYSATYDAVNRRLYLVEFEAAEWGRSLVHVFSVEEITTTPGTSKNVSLNLAYSGLWNGSSSTHQFAVVSIELRQGTTLMTSTLTSRKSGLINSSGNITIDFRDIADGNYWLVVRSSGYLPLAIPQQLNLTSSGINYNFTVSASQAVGGTNTMLQDVVSGKWMCRSGDFNSSRSNTAVDAALFQQDYGRNISSQVPPP